MVATPIGNLRDITLRALDILGACQPCVRGGHARLAQADGCVRAEAEASLAYHEHNAEAAREEILGRARGNGESVALISDAGTPLVSLIQASSLRAR